MAPGWKTTSARLTLNQSRNGDFILAFLVRLRLVGGSRPFSSGLLASNARLEVPPQFAYLFSHRPEAGDHLRLGADVCFLISHVDPSGALVTARAPPTHDGRQYT